MRAGSWHASCRPAPREEVSTVEDKPDIARFIDEAAKVIGLSIAPEYRDKVPLNYERSMPIARPLLAARSRRPP